MKKNNLIFYVLFGILIVGMVSTTYLCLQTLQSVNKVEKTFQRQFDKNTKEDDVEIAQRYMIRSTLPISNAYKLGDDSSLNSQDKETLKMASNILNRIIKKGMSKYEKEKAVYEWMIDNLSNDTGMLSVIPTTSSNTDIPYGVLKNRKGVSTGYATTFRLFMQMLDIECMVIHDESEYTCWNLVRLEDGDWYHVDIYSDLDGTKYNNFNENDSMISNNLEWDTSFFPASTGIKYNYAYQNASIVKDPYTIPERIKEAMEGGKTALFLRFNQLSDKDVLVMDTVISEVNSKLEVGYDQDMNQAITDEISSYYVVNGNIYTTLGWRWCIVDNTNQLLVITMSKSKNQEGETLSEEEYSKISEKVDEVFD